MFKNSQDLYQMALSKSQGDNPLEDEMTEITSDAENINKEITKEINKLFYYTLNKILNSDWLKTYLTLVDVWLAGSNVRQRNLMSSW